MTIFDMQDAARAKDARWLQTTAAIRAQSMALYELGLKGALRHFTVNPDQLEMAALEVVTTIRETYPDLVVPPHAQWRHFVLDGRDRWAERVETWGVSAQERARLECELAILSVLLDSGAGPLWTYRDPETGTEYARGEGLALASLDMFCNGAFGAVGTRVAQLKDFSADRLAEGLQVSDDNPFDGLDSRAALISALGHGVAAQPAIFGDSPRLGHLADHLFALGDDDGLRADVIFDTVLSAIGPIWTEGRPSLGDCWPHPQAPAPGMVPFHTLPQWLAYSLIEPMERAGLPVIGQDALTGLAEHRNGGLFLDTGVIALRDPLVAETPQDPDSPLIVEWRALTVALLDRIAEAVRNELGLSPAELPLSAVLEGGTWATGRRLARARRPKGTPPILIRPTGTLFQRVSSL